MTPIAPNADLNPLALGILSFTPIPMSRNVSLGCSLDEHGFFTDPFYLQRIVEVFDFVTPVIETERIWTRPTRLEIPPYLSQVMKWAQTHKLGVRGHALIDGCIIPSWLTDRTAHYLYNEFLWNQLERYFEFVATHLPQIEEWDVVNEAFCYSGVLRQNAWIERLGVGEEWLSKIYALARKVFPPHVKLAYCDFSLKSPRKWNGIHAWAERTHQEGLLDVIAFQLHFAAIPHPPYRRIVEEVRRFEAIGLTVRAPETQVWNRPLLGLAGEALQQHHTLRLFKTLMDLRLDTLGYWTPFDKYPWVWDAAKQTSPGWWGYENGRHTPKYVLEELLKLVGSKHRG